MTKSTSNNKPPADRKKRLAEALRANLQRRKSQARGRKVEDKPSGDPGADADG
ncbi:MAG: hypothetical protein OER56_02800 [Hyphomicrobiales bacterium]|nr:hypothetical protein [Hyphomicrobiales bacterium]